MKKTILLAGRAELEIELDLGKSFRRIYCYWIDCDFGLWLQSYDQSWIAQFRSHGSSNDDIAMNVHECD